MTHQPHDVVYLLASTALGAMKSVEVDPTREEAIAVALSILCTIVSACVDGKTGDERAALLRVISNVVGEVQIAIATDTLASLQRDATPRVH